MTAHLLRLREGIFRILENIQDLNWPLLQKCTPGAVTAAWLEF